MHKLCSLCLYPFVVPATSILLFLFSLLFAGTTTEAHKHSKKNHLMSHLWCSMPRKSCQGSNLWIVSLQKKKIYGGEDKGHNHLNFSSMDRILWDVPSKCRKYNGLDFLWVIFSLKASRDKEDWDPHFVFSTFPNPDSILDMLIVVCGCRYIERYTAK